MFRKTISLILFLAVLVSGFSFFPAVLASDDFPSDTTLTDNTLNVYFFWGEGCPHCETQKPFLERMESTYSEVKVHDFEVWKSAKNRKLLVEVGNTLGEDVGGVPFTVVGDTAFVGFNGLQSSRQIEDRIAHCLENSCSDSVAQVVGLDSTAVTSDKNDRVNQSDKVPFFDNSLESISLPLIGEIKTKDLSLPLFTIVLGALDGFNPCAMWTLLFLISLLLGMKDKRRRWILGSAFIVASSFVYFLFMAAWLNLILFIGLIVWVRYAIGAVALFGGGYNIREFYKNRANVCKVTGGERRQMVFEKLKSIVQQKSFALALIGIVLLAFAVNLVELVCSAGLPVIFTQVLALSNLSQWQYYGYMLLYIFVFMLDDLVVFFVAMLTLEATGISGKYTRVSHLVGGVLMIIIGLLLIFRPELLMF